MKANETSKLIEGIGVGNGKASGRLRFLASPKAVDRQKPKASHGDARQEWERLSAALSLAEEQIGQLFRRALDTLGEEEARIFEIHSMLLRDDDLMDALKDELEHGKSAEDALQAASLPLGACRRCARCCTPGLALSLGRC